MLKCLDAAYQTYRETFQDCLARAWLWQALGCPLAEDWERERARYFAAKAQEILYQICKLELEARCEAA